MWKYNKTIAAEYARLRITSYDLKWELPPLGRPLGWGGEPRAWSYEASGGMVHLRERNDHKPGRSRRPQSRRGPHRQRTHADLCNTGAGAGSCLQNRRLTTLPAVPCFPAQSLLPKVEILPPPAE